MAAITICSDFGAQKIKSDTVSTVSPSICHEVMGPDTMKCSKNSDWPHRLFKVCFARAFHKKFQTEFVKAFGG